MSPSIPFYLRVFPQTTAIEKHRLDYIITIWWKDLYCTASGFNGGFVCGMLYGLSVQPLLKDQRALREELLFLYELASSIVKEGLQETPGNSK